MTEMKLFELISEADCELLERSERCVKVHRKIGLRVIVIAAAISVILILSLFVGAFFAVHHYRQAHPEFQGSFMETLDMVLSDDGSFLSNLLPETVKLELGELFVKLGGQNPFAPLGPGQEEQSTHETEPESESESKSEENSPYPWHTECGYCGKLDQENRWFVAKVMDSRTVKPFGEGCLEAVSAGEAGFILEYVDENLIDRLGLVAGDLVLITYSGYVVETYPCRISPITLEPILGIETQTETETQQGIEIPEQDTNLEFWIAENVDNVDFSEYQEKYGMFGGTQYYGKDYEPIVDEYGQQTDPEYYVLYTVTSYPDYSDSTQHITHIQITDPSIYVSGMTVNTPFEEFERIVQEHGFEIETSNEHGCVAKQGKYIISIERGIITIRVEVENKDGIIF